MFGKVRRKISLRNLALGFVFFVFVVFVFILYFWHLGTLTKGLSPTEIVARGASLSIHNISGDPIYGPHKILQYVSQKTLGHGAFGLRLVSALFGLFFLGCFYNLTKSWFGKLIGVYATLFLATTPWFVLLSRSASPLILLMLPIAVTCFYYWLTRSKKPVAWLALAIASATLAYLPGGIYLLVTGIIVSRAGIALSIKKLNLWPKILGFIIGLLVLLPLIYGLVQSPWLIKPLMLIPSHWPGLLIFIKSICWSILAFLWRLPLHIDIAVGRIPILDGAQVALVIFGGFALLRLAKSKLLLFGGLAILAIVFSALAQDYLLISLALPTAAILVAAGLRYLYLDWRSVFPKNPFPKYLALGLLSLLVGLHILYGLRYTLDAWPNTSATRAVYVLK